MEDKKYTLEEIKEAVRGVLLDHSSLSCRECSQMTEYVLEEIQNPTYYDLLYKALERVENTNGETISSEQIIEKYNLDRDNIEKLSESIEFED